MSERNRVWVVGDDCEKRAFDTEEAAVLYADSLGGLDYCHFEEYRVHNLADVKEWMKGAHSECTVPGCTECVYALRVIPSYIRRWYYPFCRVHTRQHDESPFTFICEASTKKRHQCSRPAKGTRIIEGKVAHLCAQHLKATAPLSVLRFKAVKVCHSCWRYSPDYKMVFVEDLYRHQEKPPYENEKHCPLCNEKRSGRDTFVSVLVHESLLGE